MINITIHPLLDLDINSYLHSKFVRIVEDLTRDGIFPEIYSNKKLVIKYAGDHWELLTILPNAKLNGFLQSVGNKNPQLKFLVLPDSLTNAKHWGIFCEEQ